MLPSTAPRSSSAASQVRPSSRPSSSNDPSDALQKPSIFVTVRLQHALPLRRSSLCAPNGRAPARRAEGKHHLVRPRRRTGRGGSRAREEGREGPGGGQEELHAFALSPDVSPSMPMMPSSSQHLVRLTRPNRSSDPSAITSDVLHLTSKPSASLSNPTSPSTPALELSS